MRIIALLLMAAALGGCIDPDAEGLPDNGAGHGSDPGPGFAPQQGHAEDTQGDLNLQSWLKACEAGFCIDLTATNEGSKPYYVSNICVPPHDEQMTRDGETVYPREPRAYCAAWGVRAWEAGEDIDFSYEWDGKLWDDASGKMVPAPEGAYQWTIQFHAYGGSGGEDRVTLAVTHTVIIGET